MKDRHLAREAIVISDWSWRTYTTLERIAIALGRGGWRVLYCNTPASFLRKLGGKRADLAPNVEGYRPQFLGHRLNALPFAERWQARLVARQLLNQAEEMGLTNPMAIYGHGYWLRETAEALRAQGVFTVFLCMDRLPNHEDEALAEGADLVLTIPRSMYHKHRAKWGEKVLWLPEFGPEMAAAAGAGDLPEPRTSVAEIPRPRLGYLGPPNYRIHARLVEQVFRAHPNWHFLACGFMDRLKLPNLHDLGWLAPEELAGVTASFDVGFLPYDCSQEMNLHCVPLKLFDCFAAGIPVVSTPILHLAEECRDLVYLGSTAPELADAVRLALAESPDDPRREQRREIARAHCFEESTRILPSLLLGTGDAFRGHTFNGSSRILPAAEGWRAECAVRNREEQPARDALAEREAIVLSSWDWEANNIPERIAISLGRGGWRVLYCSNPATFLRRIGEKRVTLAENVEGVRPGFVGHRLNVLPMVQKWQAKLLVNRILDQAGQMGLSRPIVFYPHGYWVVDVAREFKRRGFRVIFVCMDYLAIDDPIEHAAAADLTLVIPRTMYSMLRAKFGEKVRLVPEFGPELAVIESTDLRVPAPLEAVPRPRLGYLGPPADRLNTRLLREVLAAHPEWHFVACGSLAGVNLPNVHDIHWLSPPQVAQATRGLDVGFMPYNCADERNLHCVPLKLFDYFAAGLPVVSTPLIHLWEYQDMVYLGDTAGDLAEGIRKALAESRNDPRRGKRRRIAQHHSMDELSRTLCDTLREVRSEAGTDVGINAATGEQQARFCRAGGQ
jgi:glycosyltransferase involved in cell wall biosynthesis